MPRICGDVTLAAHVPVMVLPVASVFHEIGVIERLAPLAKPPSVPVNAIKSPPAPIEPVTVPFSTLAPSCFVIVHDTKSADWVRDNVHFSGAAMLCAQ